MKYRLLGVLLASAIALPACAEDTSTVVSVKKAPYHLFTFEDENMSLENVTLPAGMSTRYHSHDQDLVFVITSGAN
jgi:quercetin dioxygenase-like cupin family protein